MTITELQHQYAGHPNVEALNKLLGEPAVRHIYCGGLYASAASLFASALVEKSPCPFVFILGDLEPVIFIMILPKCWVQSAFCFSLLRFVVR